MNATHQEPGRKQLQNVTKGGGERLVRRQQRKDKYSTSRNICNSAEIDRRTAAKSTKNKLTMQARWPHSTQGAIAYWKGSVFVFSCLVQRKVQKTRSNSTEQPIRQHSTQGATCIRYKSQSVSVFNRLEGIIDSVAWRQEDGSYA